MFGQYPAADKLFFWDGRPDGDRATLNILEDPLVGFPLSPMACGTAALDLLALLAEIGDNGDGL